MLFTTARTHQLCHSLYLVNAEDAELQIEADASFMSDFPFCSAWEESCKLVSCDFTSELSVSADQGLLD